MFPPHWGIFPPQQLLSRSPCTDYADEHHDRLLVTWWRLFRKALRRGVI